MTLLLSQIPHTGPVPIPSQASAHCSVSERVGELYEKLLQISLARSRTCRRVDTNGGREMNDIKLNLEPEFSQVAEAKVQSLHPHTPSIFTPSLSCPFKPTPSLTETQATPLHSSHPPTLKTRPIHIITSHSKEKMLPMTVGARLFPWEKAERHTFYEVETELCNIVGGSQPSCATSRPECANPVAKLLDRKTLEYDVSLWDNN